MLPLFYNIKNNMNFLISLLVNGLAVFLVANILPGVEVTSYLSAIIVAVLLGFVNSFIKPIITVLTLPITMLTLGLFLFIINGGMVLIVDYILGGFFVDGLFWATLFSIVLAFFNFLSDGLISRNNSPLNA